MITEKQIKTFIIKNKKLTDKKVHLLAAKHKMTPDKVEEKIYKIARMKLVRK